ncbi:hypothetical protein C8D99_11281 [Aminivibrio pyruvatiphilus]|uniref:Uncharacterized protein n=1 Tax=Aminivibrio pyruvatiphilus TaxID=1005740 RepID=A0A4R8M5Q4_9BACT|nr:hypothetical protein C8D99_11281 [Aminivibrio pyruvatiphilus]
MPTNDAQSCVCKASRFKPGEVGKNLTITGGRLNLYKTLYQYEEPVGDVEGCAAGSVSPWAVLLAALIIAL